MVSNPVSVRHTIYDSVQSSLVTTTTPMEIESVAISHYIYNQLMIINNDHKS